MMTVETCASCERLTLQLQDAWDKLKEADRANSSCERLRAGLRAIRSLPKDDWTLKLIKLMEEEYIGN